MTYDEYKQHLEACGPLDDIAKGLLSAFEMGYSQGLTEGGQLKVCSEDCCSTEQGNTIKHYIQHPPHTEAYFQGFDVTMLDIKIMGFDAARDKFNRENPVHKQFSSLDTYYYAKGCRKALNSFE